VDAWASSADEGRGNAAISLGQVRATVTGDFRMGQPTGFHHPVPPPEYIGRWEGTGGTETSHVPRGRESIPVVVANEPGAA